MCSSCRRRLSVVLLFQAVFAAACLVATSAPAQTTRPGVLVVVAEPNNLPFSNDREEGFENKLAQLVAREMSVKLEYRWRAMRRGYFRETIKAAEADLVLGVPRDLDMALTTDPYYRSSYVFVTRDGSPKVESFDDPALRRLTIGIPLTGEDNPPPAIALGRRGIVANVRGYMVYGNYADPNPPARLIEAVAKGEVDVAIAWGPLAGYFAKQLGGLKVTPVQPQVDEPAVVMAFDISMGVAKKNKALRDQVNAILARNRAEIDRVLDEYAVPRVAAPPRELQRYNPDDDDDDADDADRVKPEVPGCCE